MEDKNPLVIEFEDVCDQNTLQLRELCRRCRRRGRREPLTDETNERQLLFTLDVDKGTLGRRTGDSFATDCTIQLPTLITLT